MARRAQPGGRYTPLHNQVDALVKASLDPRGDYNDASGNSPFPGDANWRLLSPIRPVTHRYTPLHTVTHRHALLHP